MIPYDMCLISNRLRIVYFKKTTWLKLVRYGQNNRTMNLLCPIVKLYGIIIIILYLVIFSFIIRHICKKPKYWNTPTYIHNILSKACCTGFSVLLSFHISCFFRFSHHWCSFSLWKLKQSCISAMFEPNFHDWHFFFDSYVVPKAHTQISILFAVTYENASEISQTDR